MYKCIIYSNSSLGREYAVNTRSAYKAAQELGRAEGGEVVTIYDAKGRAISQARWTLEGGGKYYCCTV